MLDSWVRFEQQAKESEQAELVKTIVDNVLKGLSNEKTQKDILVGAIAEIEREYGWVCPFAWLAYASCRAGEEQGYLERGIRLLCRSMVDSNASFDSISAC